MSVLESLVSKATALPTELQLLPKSVYFNVEMYAKFVVENGLLSNFKYLRVCAKIMEIFLAQMYVPFFT